MSRPAPAQTTAKGVPGKPGKQRRWEADAARRAAYEAEQEARQRAGVLEEAQVRALEARAWEEETLRFFREQKAQRASEDPWTWQKQQARMAEEWAEARRAEGDTPRDGAYWAENEQAWWDGFYDYRERCYTARQENHREEWRRRQKPQQPWVPLFLPDKADVPEGQGLAEFNAFVADKEGQPLPQGNRTSIRRDLVKAGLFSSQFIRRSVRIHLHPDRFHSSEALKENCADAEELFKTLEALVVEAQALESWKAAAGFR